MKSQIQKKKKKKEGGIVELLIPTFFQKKYGVDLIGGLMIRSRFGRNFIDNAFSSRFNLNTKSSLED